MDDYIIKPVSKTELERVMNTYFFNWLLQIIKFPAHNVTTIMDRVN